jgi:hypothetical protein
MPVERPAPATEPPSQRGGESLPFLGSLYTPSARETALNVASSPSARRSSRPGRIAAETQGVYVSQNTYPVDSTQYLELPIHDFDLPDLDKSLVSITVVLEPLLANWTVTVEYDANESGSWTSAGTISTAGTARQTLTVSSSSSTAKFRNLKLRLGLASSDGADTPVVRSASVKAGVIEYQRQFQLVLKLDDTPLVGQNMSGEQKADVLKALEDAKALVEFQDHYKTRPGNSDTYTVQIAECAIDLDAPGTGSAVVTLVEQ